MFIPIINQKSWLILIFTLIVLLGLAVIGSNQYAHRYFNKKNEEVVLLILNGPPPQDQEGEADCILKLSLTTIDNHHRLILKPDLKLFCKCRE